MILATVDGGLKNPPFSLFMTPENTSVSSRAPNGGQRQTHGSFTVHPTGLGTGHWGLGTGHWGPEEHFKIGMSFLCRSLTVFFVYFVSQATCMGRSV